MPSSKSNNGSTTPQDRCPLCNGTTRKWRQRHGYVILSCDDCKNAFIPDSLIPAEMNELYSKAYFTGEASTGYPGYISDRQIIEKNFRDRIEWISTLIPIGSILEVGCAYGYFLKSAIERGWDATGVELVQDCADEAHRLSGAKVVVGDFLQIDLDGPFDVIAMFDVIEHMSDPKACFERAFRLLRPGGLLVIETGDRSWFWSRLLGNYWYFLDPPQHRYYFSKSGLMDLLRRSGFQQEIELKRFGRLVSLSNIAFKLSWALPEGIGSLLAERSRKRIPGHVYLNFGDGMVVAAYRNCQKITSKAGRDLAVNLGDTTGTIHKINTALPFGKTEKKTILSVDVEDWYHANFESQQDEHFQTDSSCVERGVDRVLEILSQTGGSATFFVLGCVAEKVPHIVKRIAGEGHEIACHGWSHALVYEQSPDEYENQLHKARSLLCDLSSQQVLGYRAPSFSITRKSLWAIDKLVKVGFQYDSSIFPKANYLYGIDDAPTVPYRIHTSQNNTLWEFPPSVLSLPNARIGVGGGFYLRVLPSLLQQVAMKQYHSRGAPFIIYTHPRELDPQCWGKRLSLSFKEQLIHRFGISLSEPKLRKLLSHPPCSIESLLQTIQD